MPVLDSFGGPNLMFCLASLDFKHIDMAAYNNLSLHIPCHECFAPLCTKVDTVQFCYHNLVTRGL